MQPHCLRRDMEKIDLLLNDENEYSKIKGNLEDTILKFDYDQVIDKYISYFNSKVNKKDLTLNEEEEKLYNSVLENRFRISTTNKPKNLLYKICRKFPKSLRIKIKKIVEKIYKFTNER